MEFKKDYDISVPSAFYLEYREGAKTLKVEMDFRDQFPVLSYRSIRSWETPYDGELISDSKRRQIMENIIFYLDKVRQFKFDVDGGSFVESRKYGH
jgi:hypothetical protein